MADYQNWSISDKSALKSKYNTFDCELSSLKLFLKSNTSLSNSNGD